MRTSDLARAEQVLEAIVRLYGERGYAPSVRELCNEVGVHSTSTVHRALLVLREDGRIRWEPGHPRTLQVVSPEQR